jgi:RNA polymerase sigma-70 factor, ECF subfamily
MTRPTADTKSSENIAVPAAEMTALFSRFSAGDESAAARLMPMIYEELRRVARNQIRRERADHTLQSTALVNEAYLRIAGMGAPSWNDRPHFFRLASQVMRNVLVDHARAKLALKRGGDSDLTSLDQTAINYHEQCAQHLYRDGDAGGDHTSAALQLEIDFVALEDALTKLRELSARQAQVVDLRFFGGLALEEIADVMQVSIATVKRDWTMARLFLKRELDAAKLASS